MNPVVNPSEPARRNPEKIIRFELQLSDSHPPYEEVTAHLHDTLIYIYMKSTSNGFVTYRRLDSRIIWRSIDHLWLSKWTYSNDGPGHFFEQCNAPSPKEFTANDSIRELMWEFEQKENLKDTRKDFYDISLAIDADKYYIEDIDCMGQVYRNANVTIEKLKTLINKLEVNGAFDISSFGDNVNAFGFQMDNANIRFQFDRTLCCHRKTVAEGEKLELKHTTVRRLKAWMLSILNVRNADKGIFFDIFRQIWPRDTCLLQNESIEASTKNMDTRTEIIRFDPCMVHNTRYDFTMYIDSNEHRVYLQTNDCKYRSKETLNTKIIKQGIRGILKTAWFLQEEYNKLILWTAQSGLRFEMDIERCTEIGFDFEDQKISQNLVWSLYHWDIYATTDREKFRLQDIEQNTGKKITFVRIEFQTVYQKMSNLQELYTTELKNLKISLDLQDQFIIINNEYNKYKINATLECEEWKKSTWRIKTILVTLSDLARWFVYCINHKNLPDGLISHLNPPDYDPKVSEERDFN